MFSTCSELTPRARIPDTRIPQFMQPWLWLLKRSTIQPFQDCTKVWMLASVPFSVPRGETTLNTAGADAPKNSRLEMFSMLKISTAKKISQIKAICTTKTSFSLSSMQHKKNGRKKCNVREFHDFCP